MIGRDVDALLALVRLTERPCVRNELTQSSCDAGEPAGTLHPVLREAACHGFQWREEPLRGRLSELLGGEHQLHAVYTPGDRFAELWPDQEYIALFAWWPRGSGVGSPYVLAIVVGGDAVIGLNTWCGGIPLDEVIRLDARGEPPP